MQSMDEIYQKYARNVYRYLLSLTCSPDLAEELTQETFYQAVRSCKNYDGTCRITTWLCGIARNVLRTYQRKHPQSEESLETLCENDTGGDGQRKLGQAGQMPSAESDALKSVERMELFRMLHDLPDPFREVLYLRIFGMLSFKEIGDVMGKSENWARVTFYRGKEKLKQEGSKL